MLQGHDATISVGSVDRHAAGGDNSALYPPLVEKFYGGGSDARGRHGSRCVCSAHAHWRSSYVDDDSGDIGLVDGVDLVPEMEFARSNVQDSAAVCTSVGILRSGVNSDPADPAMRGGARGPRGPKISGKNFFTQQFACTLNCWCCGGKLQW